MATYHLLGQGVEALSSGTLRLQVTVNVFNESISTGDAFPENYFHVGAIRFGSSGFFYPAHYIDAQQMLLDVPVNADAFGYSLIANTQITVVELAV